MADIFKRLMLSKEELAVLLTIKGSVTGPIRIEALSFDDGNLLILYHEVSETLMYYLGVLLHYYHEGKHDKEIPLGQCQNDFCRGGMLIIFGKGE